MSWEEELRDKEEQYHQVCKEQTFLKEECNTKEEQISVLKEEKKEDRKRRK